MMSFRAASRSARAIVSLEPCLMCQLHQLALTVRCNATRYRISSYGLISSMQVQSYATRQRIDGPRMRADADARGRLGFYTLTKQQGIHNLEPHTAMSIYDDFVAHKNAMSHGKNVLRVVNKYGIPLNDIASLAIVTFKIPEISDAAKRAQMPPSQHKNIGGMLLQGCAQNGDPLAIAHILTAVYLGGSGHSSAQEIARLFPQQEINQYRQSLDAINLQSLEKDPGLVLDVSTLRGLFLEQAGQKQEARKVYQEAITPAALSFQPGQTSHAMKLPLIAPWNALGYLLKADKDPKIQAEAKFYFQKGALKGDDPLSYYELAAFEPRTSEKWLRYISKAAASGHKQAILNLTNFYQEVATVDSPILKSDSIRKALNWVLSWRRGSTAALAREWQQVASVIGHKPSMLQLADYYDSIGNNERAREYLRQIIEAPSMTNQKEESPQLLQLARKRLAGV